MIPTIANNSKIFAAISSNYPLPSYSNMSHIRYEAASDQYNLEKNLNLSKRDFGWSTFDLCRILWGFRFNGDLSDWAEQLFLRGALSAELDSSQYFLVASLLLGHTHLFNQIRDSKNIELKAEDFTVFLKSVYSVNLQQYEKFVAALDDLSKDEKNKPLANIKQTLIDLFNQLIFSIYIIRPESKQLSKYHAIFSSTPSESLDEILAQFQYHLGKLSDPRVNDQLKHVGSSYENELSHYVGETEQEQLLSRAKIYSLDELADFIHADNHTAAVAELTAKPELVELMCQIIAHKSLHPFVRTSLAEIVNKYENLPEETNIITKVVVSQKNDLLQKMFAMQEETAATLANMQKQMNRLVLEMQDLKRSNINNKMDTKEVAVKKSPSSFF